MNWLKHTERKYIIMFILLGFGLLLTFALCIAIGSVNISLDEVFKIVFHIGDYSEVKSNIIWNIRMPRTLGAILGGAALAVAGIMLQVFFKNPIVEPFVLGISAGAVLMVGLVTLGGITLFGMSTLSPYALVVAALLGSTAVTVIVLMFANKVKSVVTLLVIGLMVGYICSAGTNIMVALADKEQIQGFMLWSMGSFSGMTWDKITILTVISVVVFASLIFVVKPLNAFLMGEDYATSMGVSVKNFRILLVLITSVLTSVVTAFAGPVSFIGLAVPHIARLIFKTSDNRILLPGSILMGGIVTALCDLIARTVMSPIEMPISAITAFIGAPIVIFLIMKRRTSL